MVQIQHNKVSGECEDYSDPKLDSYCNIGHHKIKCYSVLLQPGLGCLNPCIIFTGTLWYCLGELGHYMWVFIIFVVLKALQRGEKTLKSFTYIVLS